MTIKKYDSLITELSSFIQKHKELEATSKEAEFDLKWRLTQLYEEVAEEDEQKFIDIAGMQGQLTTTAQKKKLKEERKRLRIFTKKMIKDYQISFKQIKAQPIKVG